MVTTSTANGTTPAYRAPFKRVVQNELKEPYCADFMGELVCIASITGITFEEIREYAIKNYKPPRYGAFWVMDELIQKLLAAHGWKAKEWKEVLTPISGLPDIATLLIDYDEETEIGRSVVYQRVASKDNPKGFVEVVFDPAYWGPKTDIKALKPSWYIGIYPMPYPSSGIPKVEFRAEAVKFVEDEKLSVDAAAKRLSVRTPINSSLLVRDLSYLGQQRSHFYLSF